MVGEFNGILNPYFLGPFHEIKDIVEHVPAGWFVDRRAGPGGAENGNFRTETAGGDCYRSGH